MILDDLTAAVAKRLVTDKQQVPPEVMKQRALAAPKKEGFPFERNLKKPGLSFICEVKKASPSKGLIAPDFPYVAIAKEYEQAGAAAISVLTERDYFLGSPQYLQEIAAAVDTPVLCKDFIIDEYQIYEARALGASAVLLICAVLDDDRLRTFFQLADSLGLSALVEAHDEDGVRRAIAIGARIIGVNNRNLKDFGIPRYELPPAAAGTEGHPLRRRKRHQDGRPHEGPARPRRRRRPHRRNLHAQSR